MNTIKIYLSSSGSLAELKKDFPLYQGAFNDKLLNVYVPTSLLPGTVDTQYVDEAGFIHTEPGVFTALKIGMVSIGRDGRVNKTNAYYMRYLKKLVYQGVEYALYERALPQAFTLFEGQGSQAPKLIINVVNMENNNEYNGEEVILGEPKILQVITSQQCSLDVLPSTSFDRDALIEPSEWEILNGKIDDLYEKYDYIVNNIDETIENYTYDKDTIDQKDADTLQLAKDYADENFYNEAESDARFVHLTDVDEEIEGTKTFIDKVLVEDPTSNKMPVNRQTMQGYAYSKEEINNLTTPIGFETEQNFLNWLGGTFTRPDGILPSELLIGKKIIIQEEGKNNYQVAEVPVVDLSDFKVLVEDNKFAEEIGFKPYETIEADNVQDAVEEVKDEVDLKTQIVRLDNLVIESNEWIEENGEVYFDHMIPEFTNSLEQEIEIVNNNKTQSDLFIAEQITVKAVETIGEEPNLGIRLILNKAPSETITLSVFMSNSTNITFEAGEVVAKNVFYDNTASGLIADNVQDVINELSQKSNNISDSLIDLEDRVDDLESEIVDKADISYVDDELDLKADKTYVDDELDLKADKTYVDDELDLKVDKSSITQESGDSETLIMSQKSVTEYVDGSIYSLKGQTIYENSTGENSIDLSAYTFIAGDILEFEIINTDPRFPSPESKFRRFRLNGVYKLDDDDVGFYIWENNDTIKWASSSGNVRMYMDGIIMLGNKYVEINDDPSYNWVEFNWKTGTETYGNDKFVKIVKITRYRD